MPEGAIGYWTHRFVEKGVAHEAPAKRFGETVLPFKDPDGMRLALVGVPGIENEPAWSDGEVPAEHAIRGFHGVSLLLANAAPTGAILTDVLRLHASSAREGCARSRFKAGGTPIGGIVDHPRGRRLPAGAHGRAARCITSRSAPPTTRRRPRWSQKLAREPRHPHHRAEGPQLLPLGLFPRAGRRAVRDRDRRSGLRGRRAGRQRSARR